MRLVYSRRALRHIQAIYEYISRDDPDAADRTIERIRAATGRLEGFPYSGRPAPNGTRILSVPGMPYVVVHLPRSDSVRILAVFHTARNRRF